MTSKTNSAPSASYALFLDKTNQRILICKTFKYMGNRIFCLNDITGKPLSMDEIYTNIEREQQSIIGNDEYRSNPPKNLRLLKISNNSMYHICDNHSHFDNFIGGQKKGKENNEQTLRRELREELFINDEETEQERKIKDILSNLITIVISENKVKYEKKIVIYLINFNGLDESLQNFLNDGADDKIKFQKNIKMCENIDATEGEIHKLIWLPKDIFLEKIQGTLRKFNVDGVLSKDDSEFNKFLDSTSASKDSLAPTEFKVTGSDIATFSNVKIGDELEAISDLVSPGIVPIKKGERCTIKSISRLEVLAKKGYSTVNITKDFKEGHLKKIITGGFYEKYVKYKNKYLILKKSNL